MLQCVVVCCSLLSSVWQLVLDKGEEKAHASNEKDTIYCRVLQCVAVRRSELHLVLDKDGDKTAHAVLSEETALLQCIAVCCSHVPYE